MIVVRRARQAGSGRTLAKNVWRLGPLMALGCLGIGLLWAAIDNLATTRLSWSDVQVYSFHAVFHPRAHPFRSVPGRFRVSAPVDLVGSSHVVDGAAERLRIFVYSGDSRAALYAVTYVDYPAAILKADPQEVLTAVAEASFGRSMHDRVVSEAPIAVDGRPGREIVARLRLHGTRAVASACFVLAGNRLYELEVIEPRARYRKSRAEVFFDSFSLLSR